jgi:uncharacterized membrane-anchored protein YhcB (DUF1043 family)
LEHEELYNLELDPLEENNLAQQKQYRNQLEEMRTRFDQLARELEDGKLH